MIQTTHTYCVYQHRRNDTGEIFYIGIGKRQKRAYAKANRSKRWGAITNKHGYSVEILLENVSRTEAIYSEMYLISFYGRMDLGTGRLVNMTDGGDGRENIIVSKETRIKLSTGNKGRKFSQEVCAKRSIVRTGEKRSAETIRNISEAKKAKGLTGANCVFSKKIIDSATNEIFPSITIAAKELSIDRRYLSNMLEGSRTNKTNLRYLNDSERV